MEIEYVNKSYLPNLNNSSCVVLDNLHNGFIRVYSSKPTPNTTKDYIDYFINDHYISRVGTQSFSNYVNINCVSHSNFTNDFLYRNDISDIFLTYFIIIFICIYILTKFICAFRKRCRL